MRINRSLIFIILIIIIGVLVFYIDYKTKKELNGVGTHTTYNESTFENRNTPDNSNELINMPFPEKILEKSRIEIIKNKAIIADFKTVISNNSRYENHKFKGFTVSFKKKYPGNRNDVYILDNNDSSPVELVFSVKAADIISYYDLDVEKSISSKTDPTPKWSENKAITTAKIFAFNLLGKESFEYAKFLEARYTDSKWVVRWLRFDKNGNFFFDDHITVVVHEKYGLKCIIKCFSLNFTKENITPIPRQKAYDIAYKHAKRIVKTNTWFWSGNNNNIESTYKQFLVNVKPNHYFDPVLPKSEWYKVDPIARLAWNITFRITDGTVSSLKNRVVSIWIDAEKGKYLGGFSGYEDDPMLKMP